MPLINPNRHANGAHVEVRAHDLVTPAQLHGPIELGSNRHLHLRDALGARIEALSGAIWVTQNGDVRDVVLEAGDAVVVDRGGEVVVSAVSDARFKVVAALVHSVQPVPAEKRPASWLHASGDAVAA